MKLALRTPARQGHKRVMSDSWQLTEYEKVSRRPWAEVRETNPERDKQFAHVGKVKAPRTTKAPRKTEVRMAAPKKLNESDYDALMDYLGRSHILTSVDTTWVESDVVKFLKAQTNLNEGGGGHCEDGPYSDGKNSEFWIRNVKRARDGFTVTVEHSVRDGKTTILREGIVKWKELAARVVKAAIKVQDVHSVKVKPESKTVPPPPGKPKVVSAPEFAGKVGAIMDYQGSPHVLDELTDGGYYLVPIDSDDPEGSRMFVKVAA